MKIKPEHYAHIKAAIKAWLVERGQTVDSVRHIIKAGEKQPKDLERRLRWDLSYYAKLSQYFCDNVYSYANDDHIDTALRAIVAELEK